MIARRHCSVLILLVLSAMAIGARGADEQRDYLAITRDAQLLPDSKANLDQPFTTHTIECVVNAVEGDGTLYEEGGATHGFALGIVRGRLTFAVRIDKRVYDISTAYTPSENWSHIVATFDRGQMKLYLDGNPADDYRIRNRSKLPGHGDPAGVGGVNGSNPGGWGNGGLQCNLAYFHISSKSPMYSRSGIASKVTLRRDSNSILAIDPSSIKHEDLENGTFPDSHNPELNWTVKGNVILHKWMD